jgi:hypothetical protein
LDIWNPGGEHGNKVYEETSTVSMSRSEFNAFNNPNKKTKAIDGLDDPNKTDGTNVPDPSEYKSKYKGKEVKQTNINIENLMNVKSIDLTNPNNKMVIDNVKELMAQALVDVVRSVTQAEYIS